MIPCELLYGQRPPAIITYENGSTKVDSLDQVLQERNRMLSLIKANMEATQCRMKVQADKHRIAREFTIGDWVYLRLIPYQLKSLV